MTDGTAESRSNDSQLASRVPARNRRFLLLLLVLFPLAGAIAGVAWWRERPVGTAERALAAGDARQALQAIDSFLARQPDHHRGQLVRGRALVAVGEWEQATRLFSRTGAESPEDLRAWGDALLHYQQFREAIPVFERLADLQPENAETWRALTVCRYRAGELPAALDSAATLARLPGQAIAGWFQRGVIHRAMGDSHLAAECWEQVNSLAPNAGGLPVPAAEFYRVYAEDLIAESRPRLAIEFFQRSQSLQPDAQVLAQLGAAWYRVGKTAEATQCWTDSVRQDERNAVARIGLSELALGRSDADGALHWLKPLLDVQREWTPALAFQAMRAFTLAGNEALADHWQEQEATLRRAEKLQAAFSARPGGSAP